MSKKPFIIAVDGTSGSGKGTLSVRLAKHYGFAMLDTGKIYRLVASEVLKAGISTSDITGILNVADSLDFSSITANNLHTQEISKCASYIAVYPELRSRLNQMQRDFPNNFKGTVVDGRDIGTVIFPNAQIKFFITASIEVCAERRYKQLQNEGNLLSYADVLRDLRERDVRDAERKVAPSHAASDAIVIDTSYLDANSVLELAISLSQKHVNDYFNAA
ncbi:MAG: cytidylate kinase [Candidatus Midichloriaceae bacterium]|nr:cytidylate kinase [Candidatus Midichloriaceae bacterium]